MTGAVLGVVGTDTDAGKTVVAAAVTAALRGRGRRVAAVKPVATGVEPGEAGADATLLARASGADPADCLLMGLRLPRSPLAAARAEGRQVDVEGLLAELRSRAGAPDTDLLVVEGVGGLLVPLDERHTVRDLMRRLDAPVLIAGRAGLGTIGHCALTIEACRSAGLEIAGVVLGNVDGTADPGLAAENATQIEAQCAVAVLGILPHLVNPDDVAVLAAAASAHLDLDALERALQRREPAEVVRLDRARVWHPFTQTSEWLEEEPIVVRRGDGCWLVDTSGRRYLDGVASLWANVHGHAHPRLDAALREQAGRLAHSTFLGLTHEPGVRLAEELCAVAPPGLSRVFYSEAGAAAVEVALRVALLAQRHGDQPRRTRFISLAEAYHGDTAGAVSVGRSEPFHRGLDPLLVDVLRVMPPHLHERRGLDPKAAAARSLAELDALLADHGEEIAALLVEPRIQGAAGMWTHDDDWLRRAAAAARAAGALVVVDEVATGFGRTGDLFASAGAGIEPDVLTLGKGLTGGYLPLSATLVREELFERFTGPYAEHRTLYYGHTYSGNPVACAVARRSLALFEEEATVDRARALARRLDQLLAPAAHLPHVAQLRRRGVMVGIELCAGGLGEPFEPALRVGRRVVLAARRRGVVVRPLGDVVVLNPPLVLDDREASLLVDAVAEAITEVMLELPATATR